MKLCSDSQCRRKGELLGLSEFSAHRGKKDGLNIYCRHCTARRSAERRKRTVFDSVVSAIERGHRTRERIKDLTELEEDVIADVLADLWDRSEIRIVDGRYYLKVKAA